MTALAPNHWELLAAAVERTAQGDDARDVSALLAVNMMADCVRHGRRIPAPTPELNAHLAYAEVLAQRA